MAARHAFLKQKIEPKGISYYLKLGDSTYFLSKGDLKKLRRKITRRPKGILIVEITLVATRTGESGISHAPEQLWIWNPQAARTCCECPLEKEVTILG